MTEGTTTGTKPEHCWHNQDGMSISTGWELRSTVRCCWCGAETQITTRSEPCRPKGHGDRVFFSRPVAVAADESPCPVAPKKKRVAS